MERNIRLSAQTIYEKEFSVDFKGYAPAEVDQFLDTLIQDYVAYETLVAELTETVDTLEKENAALKAQNIALEAQKKQAEVTGTTLEASNVDLLKRLARLENIVLKKDM
ncbi:MAG: DivIVA domain-containing protein [Erysipelotrichaceae bacterium]|jgi:DivIVA domain-containing protein|nr:DivIVA domain-containing protein [Erysipelotrichaceae bacterium]